MHVIMSPVPRASTIPPTLPSILPGKTPLENGQIGISTEAAKI